MDLPDWVPSAPLSHATYHLVTLISSHLSAYSVTSSLNFPPNFQLHLIHLSLFLSLITDIQTCSFGELFPLSSVIVNDPASFLEVIAKTPLLLMHDFPALAFWKTSPRIFFFQIFVVRQLMTSLETFPFSLKNVLLDVIITASTVCCNGERKSMFWRL